MSCEETLDQKENVPFFPARKRVKKSKPWKAVEE
jgi:hypothetical protein